MRTTILAATAALLLFSTPALAWKGRGHMLVADIAWRHLTPATRAKVSALLKLNPDYATWVSGVAASKKDEVAFMRAAKWADDIKSKSGYSGGYDSSEAGAAGGEGYSDKHQHRYWHFKDLPFSTDGATLEQPHDINAATQIKAFRTALGSNASDDVKSYDLVWLIHLVGDVHQPLHATTRFSKAPPILVDGDRGGNDIKIKKCPSCGVSDLHTFWDGVPGTSEALAGVLSAAAGWQTAPNAAVNDTDVDAWIDDSFGKAKSECYRLPIKNGVGPYVLTTAYKNNATAIAKKRVALAGERLAKLIADNLQ